MTPYQSDLLRTLPGRRINSWWLYDERGSELFEAITELPEYYPTRTEAALFDAHAPAMARSLGRGASVVEYGAGAAVKTRQLLSALDAPRAYRPVDVAEDFVRASAENLARDYPGLDVEPVIGSFLDPLDFGVDGHANAVGFFPGSTIGNLDDAEIVSLMAHARAHLDRFLLGVDLAKDPAVLEAAYDDAMGVTAEFNLNLLARANREAESDFDLDSWAHRAVWNARASRIEMRLESLRDQTVRVGGTAFGFARGETLLTEISRKFTPEQLAPLLGEAGWTLREVWADAARPYAVLALD